MCKVVILNVLVVIKSFFKLYYDSDKLFCLNSSLQTDLELYFSKNIMYFVHTYGQIKKLSLPLSQSAVRKTSPHQYFSLTTYSLQDRHPHDNSVHYRKYSRNIWHPDLGIIWCLMYTMVNATIRNHMVLDVSIPSR